jgi:hypothetical protein
MRIIIIMIVAAMTMTATAWADPAMQQKCYDLQRATNEARARAHARALERMGQTVLQPVPSIADTSCLDSYTLGIDVGKYDPAAVMSILKRQAESEL